MPPQAMMAAEQRRDAQLGELTQGIGFVERRQQQPEILQRFEVNTAVANQDQQSEMRI